MTASIMMTVFPAAIHADLQSGSKDVRRLASEALAKIGAPSGRNE